MSLQTELMAKLAADKPELISLRRYLHAHPEVSYHEKHTAAYIKHYYEQLGMTPQDFGTGYGFVVDIHGGLPGQTLAVRADFDALPVQEENDLPFKSVNPGVMHACGHDVHTAYLMVLAKALNELRDQLHGTIRILHQPAEEVAPGGAPDMIAGGVLTGVANVIGAHIQTTMPTGYIGYHAGPTQAGGARFDLTITGHGGHASMPQLSNDAIVAGSYFVTAAQTIVSRRLDPFAFGTVTISSFDGASAAYNAIRQQVVLKGDVRVMAEDTRKLIHQQVATLAKGLEAMFGVTCDLQYQEGAPVMVNDPDFTDQVATALTSTHLAGVTEVGDCGALNPSEDFAFYNHYVPSTYFYVGAAVADGKVHPHHSPDFLVNEDSLLIAAEAMGTAVVAYSQAQG